MANRKSTAVTAVMDSGNRRRETEKKASRAFGTLDSPLIFGRELDWTPRKIGCDQFLKRGRMSRDQRQQQQNAPLNSGEQAREQSGIVRREFKFQSS
jgi:hypothetical protein